MFELQLLVLLLTLLTLALLVGKKEHFCADRQPMHDQNLLRKLYARIHGLEKLARHQIAQNNNVPYERIDLEEIEKEINATRQKINELIHKRNLPYHAQPLYNTGPHSYIIGLPSVPGTLYPWYHD